MLHCTLTVTIYGASGGTTNVAECDAFSGALTMIFSSIVARTKDRIAKRSRYTRLVAEIESLSSRDLADINGNRGEMLRHAYLEVYG
jgi:hypothetical protein